MRSFDALYREPISTACAEVVAHLDAGGDPRAHNNAALRWACWNGHLDIVERLLSLGLTADDARTDHNETLRMVCANGHLATHGRMATTHCSGPVHVAISPYSSGC